MMMVMSIINIAIIAIISYHCECSTAIIGKIFQEKNSV